MNFIKIRAVDFCKSITDGTHDSPKRTKTGKPLVTSKHLSRYGIDFDSTYLISESDYKKVIARSRVDKWDVLYSMIGTIGNIYIETSNNTEYACKNVGIFKMGGAEYKSKWLYYYLQTRAAQEYILGVSRGTTQGYVPLGALRELQIPITDSYTMNRITSVLWEIDEKIKNNRAINHNLLQQVLALYRQMFVDSPNDNRKICRADEYFDISIGKTPPRKEPEWFKTVRTDNIVWVSIADMGNCGLFIDDSSEYLSPDAVKKFNVVTVPNDTVLLSFKLTVGRIAITDGQMTTNEAIAHFKTDNKAINEYLYCYLKSYNFQTLGSTSSIATAVNSKIIKAMPFVVPTDEEISTFHDFAAPIFNKIKACQHENARLVELRDSLLPKLMSGEIDVSEVEL